MRPFITQTLTEPQRTATTKKITKKPFNVINATYYKRRKIFGSQKEHETNSMRPVRFGTQNKGKNRRSLQNQSLPTDQFTDQHILTIQAKASQFLYFTKVRQKIRNKPYESGKKTELAIKN